MNKTINKIKEIWNRLGAWQIGVYAILLILTIIFLLYVVPNWVGVDVEEEETEACLKTETRDFGIIHKDDRLIGIIENMGGICVNDSEHIRNLGAVNVMRECTLTTCIK